MAKIIPTCPLCKSVLSVPVLKCGDCGLELKNDFELSPFDCLSEEQYSFLLTFLRNRGNLKAVQEQLGFSYPIAKEKLSELLCALGLEDTPVENEKGMVNMADWDINQNSKKASDIVRAKLIACGGKTVVYTLQGKAYSVWVESPTIFVCDKIPSSFTYDIFDVIVEHIISQGGKARKGIGRGHLGDSHCGEDTLAAAILENYWHSDTGLDPGFVMVAILEWAGIIHNRRGYAELTAEYRALRGI